MLKIFNGLFFALFSLIIINNLYAIEHYISISSGLSFTKSNFEQHILKSSLYKVGKKQKDYYLAKEEYTSKIWNFKGYSPKFSLEYLAYLKGISIGVGFDTYNPKVTYLFKQPVNYNKDVKVKLWEYNIQPYAIILINAFTNQFFNLKIGTQFGVNYLKISNHYSNFLTNGKNIKQITFIPQLVAESEVKLNNKITLFSRLNLSVTNLLNYNIEYDNQLLTKEDNNNKPIKLPIINAPPKPHKLVNTSINSFIKYKNGSTYSVNLGVRYKL